MKKMKIIFIILAVGLLGGLITFASLHENEDSHLRKEGVRVRVNEYALMVDSCDSNSDITTCYKTIKVDGKDQKLVFDLVDFNENGYPKRIVATINGKVFYERDDLDFEKNGSIDYQIFLNFHVIDKYIMFTFTDGTNGRTTTLYGIDLDGNIVLEEKEIDKEEMLIKDYTDFITYKDNTIKIYATRVVEDINYKGQNVCYAKDNDIVEAYYTYTYKDGKFSKKQTQTISAKQFIKDKGIICADKK